MDYKITEEDIRNASTYVPIGEKTKFVDYLGDNRCFQVLSIMYGEEAMPPMYRENHELKSRYMLTALLKMYLHKDVETVEGDEWLMPRDEYDRWCENHVFNTIERFKSNQVLRDKVFNLLYDYKDLEKRVNLELYGQLNVMNDVILRTVQKLGEQTTPETMKQLSDTLNMLKDAEQQFQDELSRRNAIIDGTSPELAEE